MATFQQNVTAITLAKAIFYARAEFYGLGVPDFDTLEPRVKHEYVEHAEDILDAVRPVPTYRASEALFDFAVSVTRHHAKVIGAIQK